MIVTMTFFSLDNVPVIVKKIPLVLFLIKDGGIFLLVKKKKDIDNPISFFLTNFFRHIIFSLNNKNFKGGYSYGKIITSNTRKQQGIGR